jgi:hypothetical protein
MPSNTHAKFVHHGQQHGTHKTKRTSAARHVGDQHSLDGPTKLTYRACPQAQSVRVKLRRQLECQLTERQITRFERHVSRCPNCQSAWLAAFESEFESDAGKEGDFCTKINPPIAA